MNDLNELHKLIVQSHIHRFETVYASYFEQKETRPLVDFFFRKIYNLDGKKERDELAIKTYEKFKTVIKDTTRKRIQNLVDLNEITDELDRQMAQYILTSKSLFKKWKSSHTLDEKVLIKAMKNSNTVEQKVQQLQMTLHNFLSFFDLSKQSKVEMLMKPARLMAKMMGVSQLFHVFEEGYKVSKPVSKDTFYSFIEDLKKNEVGFLNKVYKKKLDLSIFDNI